jgi:hypothetical protein
MSGDALVCVVLPWVLVGVIVLPVALCLSAKLLGKFFGLQLPADRNVTGLRPCALLHTTLGSLSFPY